MIKKIICRRLEVLLFVVLIVAGLVSLPVIASAETAQGPAATDSAATEEAVPAVQGDANIGKMLYTGEKRFENGGPACISCHNVGLGTLGGGTLGPNLMLPNEKYGVGPAPQNPLIAAAWYVYSPVRVKYPYIRPLLVMHGERRDRGTQTLWMHGRA